MVERHASSNCADCKHKFLFVDDREPVMRSFRGILLNMKLEGGGVVALLGNWQGQRLGGIIHKRELVPCTQGEGA